MTAKVIPRQKRSQDQTDWSTDHMLYKTHCVIAPYTVLIIQVSLRNCSESLFIIDLVSVNNFHISRNVHYITLEI